MTIVEMRVHMDCPGCESKIKKALQKLDGVDDIDIDMNMQKVRVTGWADQNKVLKTVRKTGRNAELWPFPYNPEYHSFTHYYNYNNNNNNNNKINNYHHDDHQQIQYHHQSRRKAKYYHQSRPTATYYMSQPSSSSYNYRVHGYNGHDHGYYPQPLYSTILDEKTSSMFSDDNTNGCSIM
ncbi:unnamed protein product [Camellia sinensis]